VVPDCLGSAIDVPYADQITRAATSIGVRFACAAVVVDHRHGLFGSALTPK
jgi:hypothetical protein